MKIGILSDSHGMARRLSVAVDALRARGATALLHCGDLVEPDQVALLTTAGVPVWMVAGNMDKHHLRAIRRQAERRGASFATDFAAVPLGDGRHLAATHGHLDTLLEDLVAGGQFPFVCHGHTHQRRDQTFGPVRVLNPGALAHPRGGAPSCLLLDTDTGDAEFLFPEG